MAQKKKASKAASGTSANDPAIEQRKAAAENLMHAFNMEWVSLLAGYDNDCEHMAADLARRIKEAIDPFLAKGDRVVPRFDTYASARLFVSVQELVSAEHNIRGAVELNSRCEWTRFDGTMLRIPSQKLTIQLTLSANLDKVLSAKFIPETIR